MGVKSDLVVEAVRDERKLLLRLASIVRWKDPDMLLSWDPQGAGLGYLIERGAILGKAFDPLRALPGKNGATEVDSTRLLGHLPTAKKEADIVSKSFFDRERASIDTKEIDKTIRKRSR
jgi:DNA polymerase elongation subunit (family B)